MQNPSSILNTPVARHFGESVKHFFNIPAEQPRLLNRQPLAQRQLFLNKALENHYVVFLQLRPGITNQGPINIRGVLHRLDNDRYLLTRGHVNYFFTINQLQYIARF